MKNNQKGFSVVEILIVIVVLGLVGTVGWLVYDRQKSKTDNNNDTTQVTQQTQHQEPVKDESPKVQAKKTTPYTFNELGITMEILNDWEVKTNHTKQEGANFYSWTVEKSGADGKISLGSSGFRGGFPGCVSTNYPLTRAKVMEVAPTQNPKLMFIAWSYDYDNQTNNRTSIVPTGETVFRTTNNGEANAIENKDVKPGNHFFCLAEPQPGFSLKLNNESATGFSRKDGISALASDSSTDKYVPLPTDAQSYSEIKAMMVTIK